MLLFELLWMNFWLFCKFFINRFLFLLFLEYNKLARFVLWKCQLHSLWFFRRWFRYWCRWFGFLDSHLCLSFYCRCWNIRRNKDFLLWLNSHELRLQLNYIIWILFSYILGLDRLITLFDIVLCCCSYALFFELFLILFLYLRLILFF